MTWERTLGISLVGALAMACGPASSMAGGTEGDTEGTGSSSGTSADDGGSDPTIPDPTNASNASDSTPGTDSTGVPPMATTADTGVADTGVADTGVADTGECPYGAEGCLCDVGATCDEGLDCNEDGICVGPPDCMPIDTDPHLDEATATALPDLNCGQGMDLGAIATLWGPELDWFTFFGNDSFGCPEQPAASVVSTEPLQVCVYIECTSGADANVDCGGKMDATSADGRPGCCGIDSVQMQGYDCGFGGKDVDVYVSVGNGDPICADYELSIAF